MNNNFENRINKYNNPDSSVLTACEKFEKKYPKENQPEWLKYCMSIIVTRNHHKNWVIKMILRPKVPLQSNQHLEWNDDGVSMLIETDSITGKKSIVICSGPAPENEVFFEAEIDSVTGLATILADVDPNRLDGTKYEMNISYGRSRYQCWKKRKN